MSKIEWHNNGRGTILLMTSEDRRSYQQKLQDSLKKKKTNDNRGKKK